MENSRGKAEAFFSRLGKKIDGLFEELKQSDVSSKLEIKERLAELKRNKESLQADLEKFTKENSQNFKDISDSFEESLDDIKKAFKKDSFKNKSESKP